MELVAVDDYLNHLLIRGSLSPRYSEQTAALCYCYPWNDFHSFHSNVNRNEAVQHSPVNIVAPHRSCQSIQHQLDHDRLQNARNDQLDYQNVASTLDRLSE
jgi:hypothetical protein